MKELTEFPEHKEMQLTDSKKIKWQQPKKIKQITGWRTQSPGVTCASSTAYGISNLGRPTDSLRTSGSSHRPKILPAQLAQRCDWDETPENRAV